MADDVEYYGEDAYDAEDVDYDHDEQQNGVEYYTRMVLTKMRTSSTTKIPAGNIFNDWRMTPWGAVNWNKFWLWGFILIPVGFVAADLAATAGSARSASPTAPRLRFRRG
jgi:hypothetical protein